MKKVSKGVATSKTIQAAHGVIQTPFFMPDATRASVKSLGTQDLERIGIGPMVVNTYHLLLEPGMKIIKQMGGVHRFMNWNKPLLSDSGGFQVFSLIHKNSKSGMITDKGAVFKSPLDGSRHELTPEQSIQIQFDLGVDMVVVLDDCPPNDIRKSDTERAVERSIAWAKRCNVEFEKQVKRRKLTHSKRPKIFAVIQGGTHKDLRKQCADGLKAIRDWDGYGFGARHVDQNGKFLGEILKYTASLVPKDRLRFALGIGTPEDIVRCAGFGWDMFDCVIPTREARHGRLYKFSISNFSRQSGIPQTYRDTNQSAGQFSNKTQALNPKHSFYEILNINNSKFRGEKKRVDPSCDCELCQNYSAGYLHHLFKVGDPLALRLASIHNLCFYMKLMESLRL